METQKQNSKEQPKDIIDEFYKEIKKSRQTALDMAIMPYVMDELLKKHIKPSSFSFRGRGNSEVLDSLIEESAAIIHLAYAFYDSIENETETQNTFPFLKKFTKGFKEGIRYYEQIHADLCYHAASLKPWGEEQK